MTTRMEQLAATFNKRSEKQRLFATLAIAAVIFLVWFFILGSPIFQYTNTIKKQLDSSNKNVALLDDIHTDFKALSKSPNEKIKEKMLALETKLEKLKTHPLLTKKIIQNDADMKQLLQAISQTGEKIGLERVQSLQAVPVLSPNHKKLFDQEIEINISGGYFDITQYLQYLEKLPWHLAFVNIHYEVTQYPNAKAKILLMALSANPGVTRVETAAE